MQTKKTEQDHQMMWIDKLMERGIFKYGDRQLYELSIDELKQLIYKTEHMQTSPRVS